jgi:phage terminase small subunit
LTKEEKKKKKRPLTSREKKFIKYQGEGCGVGESALRAGYSHEQYGTYLRAQDHIKNALQTAIENAGLTDDLIAQRLREGIDAVDPEIKSVKGKVLKKETPNFTIRHKYIETTMKAKGNLAQEGAVTKQTQINIILTPDTAKGFLDSGVISKKEHGDLKEYIEHKPIEEKSD